MLLLDSLSWYPSSKDLIIELSDKHIEKTLPDSHPTMLYKAF